MRAGSVATEAWRNVLTGAARAGVLALMLVVLVGGLAVADVRAVVDVLRGAADYRATGASIQVIDAPGQVDAERCEALERIGGIVSSGALREGEAIRMLNLPSSDLTSYEATPGLAAVLRADGNAYGVLLPDDLAGTLGAAPGDAVATDRGSAQVGATYPYPSDGRARSLSYAAVEVVPAEGVFDACWAEVWPASERTSGYLRSAINPDPDTEQQPRLGSLNPRLGATYDAPALLAERLTRLAGWLALIMGGVIGAMGVRMRRLELAAALHARVPRGSLAWQIVTETALWAGAATVICAVAVMAAGTWASPDPGWAVWSLGLRVVGLGFIGALLGAVAASAATRERHLFRYFKER